MEIKQELKILLWIEVIFLAVYFLPFIWHYKWLITGVFGLVLVYSMLYILNLKSWQVLPGAAITAASALFIGNSIVSMVVGLAAVCSS